jgi:Rrf2 family transcriptional regulator, iron-sulfur cluster assembly transcription factor
MVSLTGRYALRILGYLADHPGQWVQGSHIAVATGIPSNYLSKILNQLRKGGFVSSQKGWGGGFLLKEEARKTPISMVLNHFDGPRDDQECIFGLRKCDAANPCPLHGHWERIQNSYQEMLTATTIADLKSVRMA